MKSKQSYDNFFKWSVNNNHVVNLTFHFQHSKIIVLVCISQPNKVFHLWKIKYNIKEILKIYFLLRYSWITGVGNGNPLQYSCLENPMDRGAWEATVHGVAKSRRWLSDFTFTFHFHALEKEMATHSRVLAWRIPRMGSPVGCYLWGHTELDMSDVT